MKTFELFYEDINETESVLVKKLTDYLVDFYKRWWDVSIKQIDIDGYQIWQDDTVIALVEHYYSEKFIKILVILSESGQFDEINKFLQSFCKSKPVDVGRSLYYYFDKEAVNKLIKYFIDDVEVATSLF